MTEDKRLKDQPILRRLRKALTLVTEGSAVVIALFGVWLVTERVHKWIDDAVTAKLSDEKVLRQIAAQVRPSLIFDAQAAITEDMGASQFIADNGRGIQLTKLPDGWPQRIQIDFVRQFANPPILTSLHELSSIVPTRAKGFSWQFDVYDAVEHSASNSNLWSFRLELVP